MSQSVRGPKQLIIGDAVVDSLVRQAQELPLSPHRLQFWWDLCDTTPQLPSDDSPYTPPENTGVVSAVDTDRASVYAMGMLGFELLTGWHPWRGLESDALRNAILSRSLPSIGDIGVPAIVRGRIDRLIARATSKDAALRHSDLDALKADLKSVVAMMERHSRLPGSALAIREHEFRDILDWLQELRSGGTGILEISGDSGTGKTYLWETVVDALARPEETWLYAKAGLGERRPYDTISRLLESELSEIVSLLKTHPDFGPLSSFVRTIAPALTPLLPKRPGDPTTALPDPAHALARLLSMVDEKNRPAIICIDDYQWLDEYSRTVVHELMGSFSGVGTVLITRRAVEARDVFACSVSPGHVRHVNLAALSREEAIRFIHTLHPDEAPLSQAAVDRLLRGSLGNPLALVTLMRLGGESVSNVSDDVLAVIAAERIRTLSDQARRSAQIASLVGTPAAPGLLHGGEGEHRDQVDAISAELLESGVMQEVGDQHHLRFTHDSVESAARYHALRDGESVRTAVRVLVAEAKAGDTRAAYAASELLDLTDIPALSSATRDWLLLTAARRSLQVLAPLDAIELVERAVPLASEHARVALLHVGHEAAYVLGDRVRMSHYYRSINRSGSIFDRAEARYIWIRRNYAESRFTGAALISDRILEMLDVLDPPVSWWEGMDDARQYVSTHDPGQLLQSLIARGPTTNAAATLASKTLAHMLVPTLTADRDRLAMIAYVMLRIAETHGWTDHTGLGFIAWGCYLGIQKPAGAWLRQYFRCAETIASRSDDPVACHTVRMLVTGLGSAWWLPYREFARQLAERDQEGRAVANWEYVAHSGHLHAQAMFYGGAPLEQVDKAFATVRKEVETYGLGRTAHALAKHHQAVETVMGLGEDPVRMDGTIIHEDTYVQELRETRDILSMAGFHIVKSFVALYADRPDLVLEHMKAAQQVSSAAVFFHDQLVGSFLIGVAAYRSGDRDTGEAAVLRLRTLARDVPETHLHRLSIVLAERSADRGRSRRAARRFERAARRALEREYLHEAAYASERLGDLTQDSRWWHQAESLYRRWGGAHAAHRVQEKIGLSRGPAGMARRRDTMNRFASELSETERVVDFLRAGATRLLGLSSGVQAVMQLRTREPGGIRHIALIRTESGIEASETIAPDLRLMLDEAERGLCRSYRPADVPGRTTPIIVGRAAGVRGIEVAGLVAGLPGTAAFSENLARSVQDVLEDAARVAAIVELREQLQQSREEVLKTRQELSRTERYRRQLFSTVNDAFLLADPNATVLFSNRAAARYVTEGEDGTLLVREGLRDHVLDMIRDVRDRGSVPARRVPVDGSQVLLQAQTVGEEAELAAVSLYDITETVANEQRLATKERQLIVSDRLASIGMFSSAIVHEISNPNHVLQLNTQSLSLVLDWLRLEDASAEEREALRRARELGEQIEDAARRIEIVLQMVKSYGREGRSEKWEAIDPKGVCERAVRFSRIMASQYTDHFLLSVDEDLPQVWGDASLLEQAVINLIKNACDALDDRSGRVEVRATAQDETVRIAVCDTGRGFPEHVRAQFGTPFVSGRQQEGGTGLGLSIVAGIVDKHAGSLSLGTAEGFTTCIRVDLPVDRGDHE